MNPTIINPRPYRWTREQFYQMLDLGWFQDQPVELIGGEVIEMAAQLDLHLASVTLTGDALRAAFGSGYWVRPQGSLDLSPHGVPSPDVAVTSGSPQGAPRTISKSALLVVEVSDTTLSYDRYHKMSLYAAGGIADYWIVNLVQRQLEVYRDPVADSTQLFGFRYNSRTILDPPDTVSPLAAPQARIIVADLLP
ncbi:MAG: Uma2 family endonuclease [Gemmataceae bacterium]